MTQIAAPTRPAAPVPDPEAAVMIRNGITRVQADQYHVGGYRYSSLAEALAQVTRQSIAGRTER
jgi:hypothetical protein